MRTAVFDTRLDVKNVDSKILGIMVKMFGYAAEKMYKALAKKGSTQAAEPAWFFVTESEGPLMGGELERATEWVKAAAGE